MPASPPQATPSGSPSPTNLHPLPIITHQSQQVRLRIWLLVFADRHDFPVPWFAGGWFSFVRCSAASCPRQMFYGRRRGAVFTSGASPRICGCRFMEGGCSRSHRMHSGQRCRRFHFSGDVTYFACSDCHSCGTRAFETYLIIMLAHHYLQHPPPSC
jgi:hypothetical protein